MRFLLIFGQICKGVWRGISKEVKKLSEISHINTLLKGKNDELLVEYQRLGEYMYFVKEQDEHVELLYKVIGELLGDIKVFEEQLAQLRDG